MPIYAMTMSMTMVVTVRMVLVLWQKSFFVIGICKGLIFCMVVMNVNFPECQSFFE